MNEINPENAGKIEIKTEEGKVVAMLQSIALYQLYEGESDGFYQVGINSLLATANTKKEAIAKLRFILEQAREALVTLISCIDVAISEIDNDSNL